MDFVYENYEDMIVQKEDGVVTITLNRPGRLNAFSAAMREGLKRVIREARVDDEAKVLIFTGAGRGFCSGADVGADAPREDGKPIPRWQFMEPRYSWVNEMRSLDKPIIAAVNGVAAGGGFSIALACDIRIASEEAKFVSAFVRRGLIPDTCATYFLPRIVGTARALELMWSGDSIDAKEAERIGLVNKVVPPDNLMKVAREFAVRLAKGPSVAIELTKRAVYAGLESDLQTQGVYEHYLQFLFINETYDRKEGMLSFQQKRPPEWKGR